MTIDPATPVIVGVGQSVSHWSGGDVKTAPSPQSLREEAARAALVDSGAVEALGATIDRMIVVRTMLDSVSGTSHPFGRCANPPGTLAKTLRLSPKRTIYSVVGGDQPQALVNEAAEVIFAGEAEAIMLAGSEATAAMKAALRADLTLDWSASTGGGCEDRGLGKQLLSPYEMANGLGAPTQTYPAFEHALRARLGHSREEHADVMATLWEGFSKVAEAHPYAQFPQAKAAEFLKLASAANYPVADPYLKWHVAQDAVNQGAAIILTSVGKADELGIDPTKRIFLHGYGQLADRPVSERADLSRSPAIEGALARALESADKATGDIAHFDLYSCFPCAVLLAAEALGLDWRTITATVTGGLPFFGGAGNNYSMHAIATIVERLRANPSDFGLVLANGGFLSKEAVGVYSASPKIDWQPVSGADLQAVIDSAPAPALLSESVAAQIAAYTVTFKKGAPDRAYVFASATNGRILARARKGDNETLQTLLAADPIGRTANIAHEDGVNYIEAVIA